MFGAGLFGQGQETPTGNHAFARIFQVNDVERNLPRIRVTHLASRQIGSSLTDEYSAEMFFIEKHRGVENSHLTLLGLRTQRLFWCGERALACLLNMFRSQYSSNGEC